LVGKWHLGLGDGIVPVDFNGEIKPGPLEIGFDTAFFIPATVDRVPCVFIENHRVAGLDKKDPIAVSYLNRVGDEPVGYEHPELLKYGADRQHAEVIVNGISRIGSMVGGHTARWVDEDITDTLLRHSTTFIEHNKHRPFFLLLGTHDPHVPRMPHPRFRGKSAAGIRGDAIVQLDWLAGEVVSALERSGTAKNTLVIFTSDNGPVLFDGYHDGATEANGEHQPAGGLRGWKFLRYEGGTRVPLIVCWPNRTPAGTVTDRIFSLHDLFASTAGLLGLAMPVGAGRDGLDLSALWRGAAPVQPRNFIVQQGAGGALALRKGDWKYLPRHVDPATGIGGADPRDQRFTEVQAPDDQLFDLSADPAERHNLAMTKPDKVAELAALLAALRLAPEQEVRAMKSSGSQP
jgi:arylsulfatase A-like enzyme